MTIRRWLQLDGARSLARASLQLLRRSIDPADWGRFRRVEPLNRTYGAERGTPIDRYYIDAFLERHSNAIGGCVLEVGDAAYTRRFGKDRVTRSEVLHATAGNTEATLVGDLGSGANIPICHYDCLILTQVFPFIFNVAGALQHSFNALRPGGVLLATLPGLTQVSRYDDERWGDYWRFTPSGARRLFADAFGADNVTVAAHGNVLAATALLHGLAAEDLNADELDHVDADYTVLLTVRAVRRA